LIKGSLARLTRSVEGEARLGLGLTDQLHISW
jgi:hypothetical protein